MRTVLIVTVLAALLTGCSPEPAEPELTTAAASEPRPQPTKPTEAAPTAPQAPAEPRDERAVMATVNGEPIYMDRLQDLLVRDYGLTIAQQLIANELVRQEAERHGITVTEDDVRDQEVKMIERAFGEVENPVQRRRLLEQMLAQHGISDAVWGLVLRRQAKLDKLAARELEITDRELQRAFGEQYGRKVVVRHIQTPTLSDAQDILDKLEAGEDFEELARAESTNPSAADGGLLPPIGRDTENVPPAILSAAMAMETPGELSEPVQSGTAFHVLKLDRVIPPRDVEFEDVRGDLAAELRDRRSQEAGQRLFHQLMVEAQRDERIEFVNPILKEQLERAVEEAERQLP